MLDWRVLPDDWRVQEILANTSWWSNDCDWCDELWEDVRGQTHEILTFEHKLRVWDRIVWTHFEVKEIWKASKLWWKRVIFVKISDKNGLFINPKTRVPVNVKWTKYLISDLLKEEVNTWTPWLTSFQEFTRIWVANYFRLYVNLDTLEPLRIKWALVTNVTNWDKEWTICFHTETYETYDNVNPNIEWWLDYLNKMEPFKKSKKTTAR